MLGKEFDPAKKSESKYQVDGHFELELNWGPFRQLRKVPVIDPNISQRKLDGMFWRAFLKGKFVVAFRKGSGSAVLRVNPILVKDLSVKTYTINFYRSGDLFLKEDFQNPQQVIIAPERLGKEVNYAEITGKLISEVNFSAKLQFVPGRKK